MTSALLLDTHIALWLESGDSSLRRATAQLLDEHWRNGGTLWLSAVSVWEIALLVDTERVVLDLPVKAWIERFLQRPGLEALPLSLEAAALSYRLHPYAHRDPADRLLMATAIVQGCPLVTYDERMAAFAHRFGRQIRFSALS